MGAPGPEVIGIVCCAGLAVLLAVLAFAAVVLRTACHFVGVKVPPFGRAMGVVLVTAVLNAIVNAFIQAGSNMMLGSAAGGDDTTANLVSMALGLPLGLLIHAALYTVMLDDVRFGQAVLIYLVQLLIAFVIVVIVGGMVVAVLFALKAG